MKDSFYSADILGSCIFDMWPFKSKPAVPNKIVDVEVGITKVTVHLEKAPPRTVKFTGDAWQSKFDGDVHKCTAEEKFNDWRKRIYAEGSVSIDGGVTFYPTSDIKSFVVEYTKHAVSVELIPGDYFRW